MTTDIRIHTTFKNNRKKRKLYSKLGSDGVLSLIYLWLSVAENKPEGILSGYSAEDIELDSDWFGEPGLFVKTLVECKLLDCDENNTYSLHNWATRQQWVYKSTDRSDKARFSRIAKTHPDIYLELKGKGVNAISKEDYASLTDVKRDVNEPLTEDNDTLTPAPAPAPSPKPSPPPMGINQFRMHLEDKIFESNLLGHKEKIIEFYKYRMAMKKKDQYQTEKGINGLIRNVLELQKSGLDVNDSLEYAMEKNWKSPELRYFNNINSGRKLNPAEQRLKSNIEISKEWLNE